MERREVNYADVSARRQAFGAAADDYDRLRPGYPPAFVERVLTSAGVPSGGRVLDIGAGTGLLAGTLLEAGYDVVAVEPDARMRAVLARRIGPDLALAGTAEDLPVADSSFDAVVGGQMWHWVDPARALPEIARVLRPRGALTILWILRDDRVAWVDRLGRLATLPDYYTRFDDSAVPDHGEPFGPMARDEHWFEHLLTPAEVVGQLRTLSSIALAPDADRQVAAVTALLATDPELADREQIAMPHVCKAFTARLL